ncbi:MAG: AAA family ATPase [Actinomycetota bacterium]|nr:AAA family ATPase [Actinomycetota bacterium]MDP9485603.1 AAA family ATPase [Actinomycetota bacterium]
MRVTTFRIENYKGFRDSGVVRFEPGFNVIVGQNNVGKTALTEALALTFGPNAHRSSKTVPLPGVPPPAVCRATVRFEVDADELRALSMSGELGEHLYVPAGGQGNGPAYHLRVLEGIMENGPVVETHHAVAAVQGQGSTAIEQPRPFLVGYELRPDERGPGRGTYWRVSVDRAAGAFGFGDHTNYGIGADQNDFAAKLDALFRSRLYAFKAVRFGIDENVIGTQPDLNPDASNLVQVLHLLSTNPSRWRRFMGHVTAVLPQLRAITFSPSERQQGAVRALLWDLDPDTERNDLAVSLSESGTGVGQVLAILYVAFASVSPKTIIIDEPQSFLHPGAVRKLFEILKGYPQHQYIVTTHSPNAVTAADPNALFLVRKEGEESVVEPLDVSRAQDQNRFLREVGASLADVFGADDVLWVEGPTEEECFPLILSEVAGRPLLGTKIVGVLSTGDLEGKHSRDVYRIYRCLSEAGGLVPPAVGFVFDREGRDERQREDLGRESGGLVTFLSRRMYESYLLNPRAIAEVASGIEGLGDDGRDVSPEEVEGWIEEHGREPKYLRAAVEGPLIENSTWLEEVDAAKLLKDMFDDLSGSRVAYDKIAHGVALTRWLCKNAPGELQEMAGLIEERLDRVAAVRGEEGAA